NHTVLIFFAPHTFYMPRGAAGGSQPPGGRLALRLITGTGSSNREVHLLDAEVSREYFIGRGRPTDTDADKTRIFILEDEENSQLKERNGHVSHNQGQFFFDKKTNEWLIMRTPGTSSIKYTTGTDSIPSKCYPLSEADPKKLVPGMRLLFGSRDVTFIVEEAPDKEA
ncbi:MAG: hypothetical protein K2M06_00510, partial [Muribaculaceae bacterium]|nr:hypothetical protein [Muribaculaceae bacterium]